MNALLDFSPPAIPQIVMEEEEDEGDDGILGDPEPARRKLPPADSPYWSTDDGGEEEE
ncbi:hypothetical protein ACGFIF_43050 [Kribbella sp. NPDC049174]|uniref:hypothetical protein n=1 Tax=Kribbella sp. NPDC049174 TaxID=3364112 RepID=UPI003712769D